MAKWKLSKVGLLIIVLFLVGTFLRVYSLDLARFEHEMVRDIEISEQILEGNMLLHGVLPSVDATAQNTLGPLSYYFMAIGLRLVDGYYYPLAPLFVIILLDLLAAYIAYRLGKDFFNQTVGVLALGFYLLSPWQIVNVATVLSPTNFLPLFVLIFFYSVFKLIIHKKSIYLIPALVSLALQMQFHLTSLLLFFTLLLVLILFKAPLTKKHALIGCFLALLTFVPYMVHNVGMDTMSSPFQLIDQRAESTYVRTTLESFGTPLLFFTPYLGNYMLGAGVTPFASSFFDQLFLLITGGILVLFLLSFIYMIVPIVRKITWKKIKQPLTFFRYLQEFLQVHKLFKLYSLLIVLYLLPLMAYTLKGGDVTPHYFIIVFPLPAFILGVYLSHLLIKKRVLALNLVSLLFLSYIIYVASFYNLVADNGGTKGISGIPYRNKMELVEYLEGKEKLSLAYYANQRPFYDSINYLLSLKGVEPKITLITSVTEFEEGYLLVDRYSFYRTFSGTDIPAEDHAVLDGYQPMSFKHLEIVKKT